VDRDAGTRTTATRPSAGGVDACPSESHAGADERVGCLVERVGWAAVDLGPLRVGGRLLQFPGGPLPTLSLILER
jgi:predicted dinucleotide-binding enzyme